MISEYSDRTHDTRMNLIEGWYNEFEKDDLFLNLSSQNQDHAGFIIHCFTEYMYSYQGVPPKEWNVSDMREICTDIMPRKITAQEETFASIAPVLQAFFLFLHQQDIIPNAKKLSEKVASLGPIIIKNASNPSNWGMAKSMAMMAEQAGVDFTDIDAMNRLLQQNRESRKQMQFEINVSGYAGEKMLPITNPNKIGVNEKCTCGSGKKYKKCCIDKKETAITPCP